MSDGPHRSLPMGRRWKKLAQCIDNALFSNDEVQDRRDSAILGEFSREVPDSLIAGLRDILCSSDQGSLFTPSGDEIENLRIQANGSSICNLLLDCAIDAVDFGQTGEAALAAAFSETANEILDRHARGMAEHYQRETGAKRASHFQSRMGSIQEGRSMEGLVNRLVQGRRAMAIRAPTRHTGLDDGVRF
ncbi:hypothetical protein [Novosphingobium sp. KACC 22771]|uniref:hypothetical protein n=1 Tax=Novosphingobium sp. KACC 22771 TaxID=3025670 RepID=UPI002364FF56|nr:hypothetical protein [Novosphingobium sp. KACC 22771]WDF72303.1 hypothetical protein PQ467_16175 [Novosphingobium sp. KACC 22771]